MDNLTHTLTGLALSQAGLNRKTRFATPVLLVASNLPDVDSVAGFGGGVSYLRYHRGITHSLAGITVLAAVLAGIVYYAGRKAPPPRKPSSLARQVEMRWVFVACWIGTASHLLLDFTNSYGVRLFLPFNSRWYAWDIMFIFDPLLLALLVAGLGIPLIFRLIAEEIGARKSGFRAGAVFSLCAMVALWGARDLAHRKVLGMIDSHTYGQENPNRLGVFPSAANPFAWVGVVETDSSFFVLVANALDNDVEAEGARVFHKTEPSPALDRAIKTHTAVVFTDFARFLWPEVIEDEQGFDIHLNDLRSYSPASGRALFMAEIQLDKSLQVRSESFSFRGGGSKVRD